MVVTEDALAEKRAKNDKLRAEIVAEQTRRGSLEDQVSNQKKADALDQEAAQLEARLQSEKEITKRAFPNVVPDVPAPEVPDVPVVNDTVENGTPVTEAVPEGQPATGTPTPGLPDEQTDPAAVPPVVGEPVFNSEDATSVPAPAPVARTAALKQKGN